MVRVLPSSALLFTLIVCALPLAAQPSWDVVRGLPAGTPVKVREARGPEYKGTISSVTPEAVALNTGHGPVSVERAKVGRVQVHASSRRLRNFAIGAAIGLGVGIAIDQTFGRYLNNESSSNGRPITFIAPIGIFGAIGAAIPPYRTIYKSR